MAFRIKDFLQITGGMISHMRAVGRRITDYNVGSVARTMIEAPAAEFDELYQAFGQGIVEGIPVMLYQAFEFDLEAARAASGYVRVFCNPGHNAPVNLPMGMLVGATGGAQYRLAAAATIPVGVDFVDAVFLCTTEGPAGNAAPGAINRLISSGSGATSVTNLLAFQNGKGKETPAERKLRFGDFVETLACGTINAVRYAARAATVADANGFVIERVARTTVEETPGHVNVWMHNGIGNVSAALVKRAEELVEGYAEALTGIKRPGKRPTGMRVDVHVMHEVPVDVSLVAQVPAALRTEATKARIREVLAGVIRAVPSEGLNARLLPLDLENAPLALEGVVLGALLEGPTLVVPCPLNSTLVPGALDIRFA